jgi:hypothetical protein
MVCPFLLVIPDVSRIVVVVLIEALLSVVVADVKVSGNKTISSLYSDLPHLAPPRHPLFAFKIRAPLSRFHQCSSPPHPRFKQP